VGAKARVRAQSDELLHQIAIRINYFLMCVREENFDAWTVTPTGILVTE
jgi:hypothetical protein